MLLRVICFVSSYFALEYVDFSLFIVLIKFSVLSLQALLFRGCMLGCPITQNWLYLYLYLYLHMYLYLHLYYNLYLYLIWTAAVFRGRIPGAARLPNTGRGPWAGQHHRPTILLHGGRPYSTIPNTNTFTKYKYKYKLSAQAHHSPARGRPYGTIPRGFYQPYFCIMHEPSCRPTVYDITTPEHTIPDMIQFKLQSIF